MTERRRYAYRYTTESTFVPEVEYHFFKFRMIPCINVCQQTLEQQITVTPACQLLHAVDGLGNAVQYGSLCEPHGQLRIVSQGVVECRPYVLPDNAPSHLWLCASPLVAWDQELRSWAERQALQQMPPLGRKEHRMALSLMAAVHHHVQYQRFVTDNATSALDVFRLRQGVCQDYAHLLIAACRSIGLHARYVNGLVEGEGETHAWVEVYDGEAWHGYDPTHNQLIRWGYIKLAHGRDVSDCPSNRGRIYGWTTETMTVNCNIGIIVKSK